jgi:hypothetical protein
MTYHPTLPNWVEVIFKLILQEDVFKRKPTQNLPILEGTNMGMEGVGVRFSLEWVQIQKQTTDCAH